MANMIEKDILDALDDLGYEGAIKDDKVLRKALEEGVKDAEYTSIIAWLSSELKLLCNLEEQVHAVKGEEDEGAFLMEVSGFVKELGCPYSSLTEGPFTERLSSPSARMELLNFLITELLAARLTVSTTADTASSASGIKSEIPESSTASHLKAASIALGLQKPPDTITSQQLFSKLVKTVKERSGNVSNKFLGRPLFIGSLSEKQWLTLDQLNDAMKIEYKTRTSLLLQRLDVTVQSFTWSDRVKKKEDELVRIYKPLRQALNTMCPITIADLLAARDDLTLVEKTASSNLRTGTTTKLNKLMIQNKPPDRGGRPNEIEPPPPEMPPWQQRSSSGQFGGAPQAQRQAGGRGSGRVQGGGWHGDQGGGSGGYVKGRQDSYQKGYQQPNQYADPYQQQNYGYQQQNSGYDQPYNQYQQPNQSQYAYQQSNQQQGAYGGGYQQDNWHRGGGSGYQQQQYDGAGRGRGRGRGRGDGRGRW